MPKYAKNPNNASGCPKMSAQRLERTALQPPGVPAVDAVQAAAPPVNLTMVK